MRPRSVAIAAAWYGVLALVMFSAQQSGLLHPSPYMTFSAAWLAPLASEGAIFPGLVIALLAFVGIAPQGGGDVRQPLNG